MSCKIRRNKKCITKNVQINEGILSLDNNSQPNILNLIAELYGTNTKKLCNEIITNFQNKWQNKEIIVEIGDAEIPPKLKSFIHNKLAEYIIHSLFDKDKIITSNAGVDFTVSEMIDGHYVSFDVKTVHNGNVNHGHCKPDDITNILNSQLLPYTEHNNRELFIENFRSNFIKTIKNDDKIIQVPKNITDLIIFLYINNGKLDRCYIVPFICCINARESIGDIAFKTSSSCQISDAFPCKAVTDLQDSLHNIFGNKIK